MKLIKILENKNAHKSLIMFLTLMVIMIYVQFSQFLIVCLFNKIFKTNNLLRILTCIQLIIQSILIQIMVNDSYITDLKQQQQQPVFY